MLYNRRAEEDAGVAASPEGVWQAAVRRAGRDVTLIAYGGALWRTMAAAVQLAGEGIEAEVIDLRALRPLDDATIAASVAKTRRAVVVDDGWRSGSLAAEVAARITEGSFWSLDAPIERVCGAEVPIPYPRHLEQASLPQPADIVAAAKRTLQRT
jgi:pyruvate dehydrogenase E1 component beta subunit/2-oxoisovalerate dehydrogenase E1 component